jgi:hypothetical protein
MPGEIKPIETLYRDHWFRSRLEARWAVFFDALGVPWRYEEEGIDLADVTLPNEPMGLQYMHLLFSAARHETITRSGGSSKRYLPDFYLPYQDYWAEIKAQAPSRREAELMARLAWGSRKSGYVFWDRHAAEDDLGSDVQYSALASQASRPSNGDHEVPDGCTYLRASKRLHQ